RRARTVNYAATHPYADPKIPSANDVSRALRTQQSGQTQNLLVPVLGCSSQLIALCPPDLSRSADCSDRNVSFSPQGQLGARETGWYHRASRNRQILGLLQCLAHTTSACAMISRFRFSPGARGVPSVLSTKGRHAFD